MNKILVSPFVLALLLCLSVTGRSQEVLPTKRVSGKNQNAALRNLHPESCVVESKEALDKIWQAWRPGEDLWQVDFDKHIVLVEVAGGPNNVFTNSLVVSRNGDLNYDTTATRKAGPGFGYLFLLIPKAGIQSVKGTRLSTSSPSKPISSPLKSVPPSIKVEVVGKIHTGLLAIGGETTGTAISSNGIVWELDLQNNREHLKTISKLTSLARVTGRLEKVDGIEVPDRMVIRVDRVLPVNSNPQTAMNPGKPDPAPQQNPAMDRNSNELGQVNVGTPRTKPLFQARSFRKITISTTGGIAGVSIKHIAFADGKVTRESRQQLPESWQLDNVKLAALDRLVAQTDWTQVKRVSRSSSVKDAFEHEILLETDSSTLRFLIDEGAVNNQEVLRELIFSILVRNQS